MKKLEISQMENLQGGKGCGKAGAVMSIAGGILGVAAMVTNPVTFIGGVALGYGLAFGDAGIGCGIGALID